MPELRRAADGVGATLTASERTEQWFTNCSVSNELANGADSRICCCDGILENRGERI